MKILSEQRMTEWCWVLVVDMVFFLGVTCDSRTYLVQRVALARWLNSLTPEMFPRSVIVFRPYPSLFGPLTGSGNQTQLTDDCLGVHVGDTGGGWY